MTTRRQEKVARVIKEIVSDIISNHLNDPRIEGFISVTKVEITADLRIANVHLSIFGKTEASHKKTFNAIGHAKGRIQSLLANKIKSRFCPALCFRMDEEFKKTLETMSIIDKVAGELKNNSADNEENRPEIY